jgi:RNA polymerase sigma factor (sigma-70 family)
MFNSQASVTSNLCDRPDQVGSVFWHFWHQNQDYLYYCCLKWMNGNSADAEDALSMAMIKAWEKVQHYGEDITNFKAWLTRLTHNLCVDIHRERNRSAKRVEDIEVYTSQEEQGKVFQLDTPGSALERDEKKIFIQEAIANLPNRLRETFILHFYHELSYQEIAERQDISYPNVCKRISQARAMLRDQLEAYFLGEGSPYGQAGKSKTVPLEFKKNKGKAIAFNPTVEQKQRFSRSKSMKIVQLVGATAS